jgi:hypothetical protein
MQDQTGTTTTSTNAKSERPYTAHDLLGEVLRDYPDATDTKRRAVFVSLARDHDGIATQIIGAWFDRYNSRHRYDSEKIASTVRELILLAVITPNGKKLRDLTGRECGQAGGWFAKLAGKVKATQKVGTVLTEPELRELWAA